MRHSDPTCRRRVVARAALLFGVVSAVHAGLLPTAASGGTNLYAPYSSSAGSVLSQFAVAPDGSLSALAPVALDGQPQDIAITPDGRFAYLTLVSAAGDSSIAQFARGTGGLMEPIGSISPISRVGEILVNPQGTRVFYTETARAGLSSRAILADGRLGGESGIGFRPLIPESLAMTPSGRTLYIAIRGPNTTPVGTPPSFLQHSVDPETGTLNQRAPSVRWPAAPAGANNPDNVMDRMTVTPDGRHLYGASGWSNTGIARFAIDAAEVIGGGAIVGVPSSRNGGSVAPVSSDGRFLWAPTSTFSPGQIERFSINAAGELSPLSPASAPYTVDAATRDAVASPDGRALYLGQDANLGVWSIAAGTLTSRANLPIAIIGATNAGIALAPSQAPVASWTVVAQPAGSPTTFDAGGSSDPDGSIVRYDWSFGDGMTLADGGATPSHVYTAPTR